MGDVKNGYQATPNATLEQQMMDACAPKNEREWWAFAEIGRLRAEVEVLRADAERYRWIDEHCLVVDRVADSDNFVQVWAGDRRFYGRTLEAAIDAARAAQGERG